MSNNTNINLTLTTKSKMAKDSLHDLSNSFVKLGKDGKRANNSIGGLITSLGGLNTVIKGVGLYKLSQGFAKAIQSAFDMRESIHMYNIAMGEFAESTGESIDKLSQLTGLDRIKLADTIGEYNLLARSMGLTAKNASILSENTNRLALDLSALTNRSIVKVQEDLRSGLIGQSKTMYKYGIDVTEAAIKQEALNMGISKSVRHMSQGEKMALRYSVMIRQAGLSHGDFANTINEPANQLRILSDRFLTLTRAIGSIFIPMVTKLLPYLNAILKVLIKIIQAIALLVGYDKEYNESFKNTNNSGFGIDNIGESADGAGKKVDKLKKKLQALAGFDEINIIGQKTPEDTGGSGGDVGGGGSLDIDLEGYDSLISQIESKADAIARNIEENLAKIVKFLEPTTQAFNKLWNEGLAKFKDFTFGTLSDFYNNFLVPIAKWTFGTGLTEFFNITNDILNVIDWNRLRESLDGFYQALTPFTINIGEGLLWLYENVLAPLAVWVISDFLPVFLDSLSSAINLLNAVIDALKPLFTWFWDSVLSPIATWTGGVMVEVLGTLVDALDGVSEWISNNESTFRKMTGTILTFFGAWQVVKLMAFIEMSGGVVNALNLMSKALWGVTGAKLASKLETMAIIALYAKDFIMSLMGNTSELLKNSAMWIYNTANVVAGKVALIASKVATTAWTAVTVTATAVGKAFGAVLAFLTSPIGLVVVAITALIAIGVSLYKNWDTVKEVGAKSWDAIKVIFENFRNWLGNVFATDWSTRFGGFGDVLNGFLKTASGIINGIETAFKGIMKFLQGTFTGDWKKMWQGLASIMDGIAKTFVTIMKAPLNGVISLLNGAISGINRIEVPDWIPGIGGKRVNISKIPMLARGGIVDVGQQFIAGENGAELIGSHGGKTTVMPLEDSGFVEAMRDAVYSAVVSAGGGNNGGIIIQIGERTILDTMTDGVNRETRINGKSVITV